MAVYDTTAVVVAVAVAAVAVAAPDEETVAAYNGIVQMRSPWLRALGRHRFYQTEGLRGSWSSQDLGNGPCGARQG